MADKEQCVAAYIFTIKKGKKLNAFGKMAFLPGQLADVPGVSFAKMMGSGNGEGFSFWPNLGVYSALMVFEDASACSNFENSLVYKNYTDICSHIKKIYAQAYAAHGEWNGIQPFQIYEKNTSSSIRMVLTRASIKTSKLWQFWKHVPHTSVAISKAEGRIFSIGVGELPWIEQATFSIWESEEAMKNYAYKNQAHLEAIKKTKTLNWYSEELFARFFIREIIDIELK